MQNVLAMDKLKWRKPKELFTGNTPDTSMFKHRMWEKTHHCYPKVKQPEDTMKLGRFLGIACQHGDSPCYFIRTNPEHRARSQKLV